jgi:hypothetical protein
VCLDELHIARFTQPPTPIVPVMLMPCSPPWIICRLQWLDFNKADTDDTRYRNALADLLRTIRLVRAGGTLSNRSIDLEPLDFDLYLKAKTREFVGREWLVSEVLQRVCAPNSSPVILMTGEAGWGKTAFAAHLFNTDPTGRLLAAHFCRNDRPDTVDPHRFVENIAALTALRVEPYNERLRTLIGAHPELLAIPSAAEKFERLFLEPLDAAGRAAPLDPLPRYFLVDGLDETLSKEKETIHGLLVQSERLFPSWLKLIATTRETSIVTGAFSDPVIAKFERHDQRNLSDITQIVKNVIEGRAPGRTVVPLPHVLEELVRVVTAKADGIAYYATQLAREVRGSGLDLHAITALPRETVAFNLAMFRRRFDPEGPEWAAAREVLEMVLATPDIVPIQLVVSVRGDESEYRTRATIDSLSDWIEIDKDAIGIRHALAAEFLLLKTTPFFVNAAVGAAKLAEFSTTRQVSSETLRLYFGKHEIGWILKSGKPSRFGSRLPVVYEHRFAFWDEENFRPAFPLGPVRPRFEEEVFFSVFSGLYGTATLSSASGQALLAPDGQARGLPHDQIRILEAAAGSLDTTQLVNLVDYVFAEARSRFDASYYPLRKDAYEQHYNNTAPTSDANQRTMMAALNIAQFGLLLVRNLAEIRPDLRPELTYAIKPRADDLFFTGRIDHIDGGLGSYLPPLQEWFVPVAERVAAYANMLVQKLTSAPDLRLWR